MGVGLIGNRKLDQRAFIFEVDHICSRDRNPDFKKLNANKFDLCGNMTFGSIKIENLVDT